MKMWIARSEGASHCVLFKSEKPHLVYDQYTKKHEWIQSMMWGTYMCLSDGDFPEVTFENSPMEVELVLKK